MAFKVFFNGYDLSKYLNVVWGFSRDIISDRTNTVQKVGNNSGSILLDSTIESKTIKMPFIMLNKNLDTIDKLAKILNVSEEKELVFEDQTDRIFFAIPTGSIDFDELRNSGKGTINWLVTDSHSHAAQSTKVDNFSNSSSPTNTVKFFNNGTDKTPIKVSAEMLSDNGFLGLTLGNRFYQIGNPQEVDGTYFDNSEELVKGDPMPTSNQGEINKPNFEVIPPEQGNLKLGGTIGTNQWKQLFADGFGDDSYEGPHGPSITFKLPADSSKKEGSKDFEFRWHSAFRPTNLNQLGEMTATIHDESGRALASMAFNNLTTLTTDTTVRFDINGKSYFNQVIPNMPKGFEGHAKIIKSGNQFTFAWFNLKPMTFICNELAESKAYYVSFSFLKWKDYSPIEIMGIINWNFRKNFTDFNNIPNFFQNGDVLTLDSESNQLKINELTDWDRVDIGSQPLLADVGENELKIINSDWAKIPKVSVEFRERWL
ncbi:distal tail protein Dit [Companilactobacillus sp. DQM5]|uniref:distal tail protein Dit n=1 Tax=Companilactobacillus sp. DQM5 TaxID=3463359 RepID=UPI004059F621